MKPGKTLFFKTLVSLLLAVSVLSSGMLLIAASDEEAKPINIASLTPDVSEVIENSELPPVSDGSAPTSQTQLEGEFGEYSFVSEEEGKSVVTIYSAEQIADFVTRRENGEWFALSAEEILYLINDTRSLFEEYDIIRIYDLEGNLNSYRGMSFYSSEEYYSAFGVVSEDVDASFNLSEDMHFATVNRLTVLNSAVAQPDENNSTKCTVFFTGLEAYPDNCAYLDDQAEMDVLGRTVDQYWFWQMEYEEYAWYEAQSLQAYDGGAFILVTKSNATLNERAYYISDISALDLNDYTCLYENRELYDAGKYEYANDGKAVIVEVFDENAQKLVARLRLDDVNDAQEVATVEQLWDGVDAYLHSDAYEAVSTDDYFYATDYTVTVYLHNIDWSYGGGNSTTIHYRVDETSNIWSFGEYELQPVFQLAGTQYLAEYIHSVLQERLVSE